MRRGLAAVALAALVAVPSPAVADAMHPVPDDGVATCARDVGGGQMTLQAQVTRRSTPTDLLNASPERIERTAGTDLGNLAACPEAASGGGVTVIAGLVRAGEGLRLRAAVRTDTGGFAAPVTLGTFTEFPEQPIAVAVGPRGDAIVAWEESNEDASHESSVTRIRAARRVAGPGAEFGPAETVVPASRQREFAFGENGVAVGVDGDGRVTVAWAAGTGPRGRVSHLSAIGVSTAAPGEPLKSVTLSRSLQDAGPLSLAVTSDGAALLSVTGQEQVHLFDRPAGGSFTELAPLGPEGQTAEEADVALDSAGGAIVAWRYTTSLEEETGVRTGIQAARRPPGGAFGPPAAIWSRRVNDSGGFIAIAADKVSPPLDPSRVRTAITPDGSTAIAWLAPQRVAGDRLPAAMFARAGPQDRFTVGRLASPCRPVNGALPFRSGSKLIAAWTDNAAQRLDDELEFPLSSGRLHATDPSLPRAAVASVPPRLTVPRVRRVQRLWADDAIEVPVECDGPCDVRAFVPGGRSPLIAAGASLDGRGRATVGLYPFLAPRIGLKVVTLRVDVHGCSPDGTSMSTATTRVRVVRNRPPKVPPPIDVKARRSGSAIVVTWRTPFAARRTSFSVYGHTRRDEESSTATEPGYVDGRGRSRFRTRLQIIEGADPRFVTVDAYSTEFSRQQHEATVPVQP